ncbi:MAG: purine-nucleoside phosphorylase [Calditrichaeota bacterium]|nr:MAG: purine-nucleoside phosphorylase [Calditrichota bacterium]
MQNTFPILEFDPHDNALIRPEHVVKQSGAPERCVLCFFQDVLNKLCKQPSVRKIKTLKSEIGSHPVYEMESGGRTLAVFHPGVGAPLSAALFEQVIAMGCRKFVACGSAGVLDSSIEMGDLMVPTAAVRDEGTSYHYLPPGREVKPGAAALEAIEETLQNQQVDHLLTKTWTTDAIYRETPAKIFRRRADGCLAVEMEAAALFAVAQFREVELAYLLYAGDDLGGKKWKSRGWTKNREVRERLFWLAVEAALAM